MTTPQPNDIAVLACDKVRGWCIFAFPDGQVQLDFGPAAFLLDADA